MTETFIQSANGSVVIEAEHGHLTDGEATYWSVKDSSNVTGTFSGKFLDPITPASSWDRPLSASAHFLFEVSTTTTFNLFLRCCSLNGKDGGFWVSLNGDLYAIDSDGLVAIDNSSWSWELRGNAFTLHPGQHGILIFSQAPNIYLDRIALQPDTVTDITQGLTSIGPAESATVSSAVPVAPEISPPDGRWSPENYFAWQNDPSKNSERITLVEVDHADATIYLASKPYVDEFGVEYNDWLVSDMVFDQRMSEHLTVGDFEAANPDLDVNWAGFNYTGRQIRVYSGSVWWKKSQFKLIGTATVNDCALQGGRLYRFSLLSGVRKYNRTFHTGAEVEYNATYNVTTAIEWLISQHDPYEKVEFINVPNIHKAMTLRFSVTETTVILDLINEIALSIRAFVRFSQDGVLQIVRRGYGGDQSLMLDNDNTIKGSVKKTGVRHPVKNIIVKFNAGLNEVGAPTGARTGHRNETITVDTLISYTAHADIILDELKEEYRNKTDIYSMTLFGVGNIIQCGNILNIANDELHGAGIVEGISRRPQSHISVAEVAV